MRVRLPVLSAVVVAFVLSSGCGGKDPSAFEKDLVRTVKPLTTKSVAWSGDLDGGYRGLVLRGRDNAALERAVRRFLTSQGRQEKNGFQYVGSGDPGLVNVNVLPRELSLVPSDAPDEAKRSVDGVMVSFTD